jgi:hypothetical protein
MPTPESVRSLFGDLLGKGVALDGRAEPDLDDEETAWMSAIFVEDDGAVGGACLVDLALGAYAGAALAMVPKPVAEEAIKAGELDSSLEENLYEVTNIASALLNGPSHPHLKLSTLERGVPDEVRDLVLKAAGRRTFDMTISDYGTGVVAFYAR